MAKDNSTHVSYDFGVLDFLGTPKTKTTLCNKRVSYGKINNRYPTCPTCQIIQQETIKLVNEIQATNPSLTGHVDGQPIDHL